MTKSYTDILNVASIYLLLSSMKNGSVLFCNVGG